ncbi:hypothetical protein [Streptomyces sp. NPDC049879]|uniref:hypothetical protein n=1 Tax=Streptomyces sp. NPDC049879 TaxID=3365598 RepID=UPI0037B5EA13
MRRTGRRIAVIPLLALPLLGLAACGEEDGTGRSAGTGAADEPVDEALVARAAALDTTVDMVYVTEAPGFTLAVQSVGPLNASGFQSSYTDASGAVLHLTVDHAPRDTEDLCPVLTGGEGWFCATDGGVWTASSDASGELRARVEDGRLITVAGDTSVPAEALDAALEAAHQADAEELAATLPDAPDDDGTPVERGDLPANGDGAPVDPVDPENASG